MLTGGAALLVGAAVGFAAAWFMLQNAHDCPLLPVAVLCSLLISFFLHVVIHEGGHLICGLLSGYRFVSYRAGSIIWVRQKGRIVRKRFSIPGTEGQCLLDPPEPKEDGSFPCLLYNLGGGLANFLTAILAAATAVWADGRLWYGVLLPFCFVGLYLAVVNLIPLKIGGIANDGYNIRAFRSDPGSAKAFWLQMRINRMQQTDGLRLCEIPEVYFAVDEEEKADPLVDALKVMRFQRLIDEKRFEEAGSLGRTLEDSSQMLELYRKVVRVELLFLELIGSCRPEEIKRLYTDELRRYLKQVRGYPSTHRVLCAYAVRFAADADMEIKERKAFEKVIKKYPTPGEIRTERELMEVI